MKVTERQIRRLIREILHSKKSKLISESIVDTFIEKAKEIGGQALEYAKDLAKIAALTPAGIVFTSLVGCSPDGKFESLKNRHFVWWCSGGAIVDCTCDYTAYQIEIESNHPSLPPIIAHILEWPTERFDNFTSGDINEGDTPSIFDKGNFNGGTTNEASVLAALKEYEKNPKESDLSSDALSEGEMSALDGGAALLISFYSNGQINYSLGLGDLYGEVQIGMNKDSIIAELRNKHEVYEIG